VERSDEVREVVLRWYRSWSDRDVPAPLGDSFTFIGTDASEFWTSTAAEIRALGDAQREELEHAPVLQPGELEAWSEGSVGWAVDRPRFTFPDRPSVPLRLTAVALRVRGRWVLVHAHVSVGVPNEEVVGRRLTTSIDELESAVLAERPDVAGPATSSEATILFTDIEGSTELLAALGDVGWLRVLRWHNRVVRDAVLDHAGLEVKAQGDGFMLAFGDPGRALSCAASIRTALADAPDGIPEVRVRIGVHLGPVTKELSDYYGTTVHLAARIASAATGGEILVSAAVHDRVADSGLRFGPPREVLLKGFAEPERLHPLAPVS